jgi:excisionase family DNA binding protein
LTADDVAKLLGVTVGTVRSLARRGVLVSVNLAEPGHRPVVRFRRADVDRYISSRARKPVRLVGGPDPGGRVARGVVR